MKKLSLFCGFFITPFIANAYVNYSETEHYSYGVAIQNASMNEIHTMHVNDENPYRNYNGCIGKACGCSAEKTESEHTEYEKTEHKKTEKSSKHEEYDKILNPFFQKKGFYSITDYTHQKYKFDWVAHNCCLFSLNEGDTLQWDSKATNITEELGIGFTDNFAIFGALMYNDDTYKLKDKTIPNNNFIADPGYYKDTDDGINNYWVGLSWKPYEDDEFVTRIIGGWTDQDKSSYFNIEGRLGYKLDLNKSSVFYIKGAAYFVEYDEFNSFIGVGINDLAIDFKDDVKKQKFYEFGLGAFLDLGYGFSLDLSGMYGNYDWHKDIIGRAELGYQIGKGFALYGYGRYVLKNSADDKSFYLATYTAQWEAAGYGTMTNISDYSLGGGIKIQF